MLRTICAVRLLCHPELNIMYTTKPQEDQETTTLRQVKLIKVIHDVMLSFRNPSIVVT